MNWALYFVVFLMSFGLLLSVPGAEAVIVLKTKNKHALIHLEGLKTKKGAYFSITDLQGRKKGIVRIKRVARTKAIGVVKYGSIAKEWSLEPMSREKAVAIREKAQDRVDRIARLQKEKIKRKLVQQKWLEKKKLRQRRLAQERKQQKKRLAEKRLFQKLLAQERKRQKKQLAEKRLAQRQLAQQKKLAKKKKALRRKLASYQEEELVIDLPENNFPQSEEVLSYAENLDSADKAQDSANGDKEGETYEMTDLPIENPKQFVVGFSPLVEYNLMKITPPRNQPGYLMSGLGFGGSVLFDFSLNRFIGAEALLGYKRFAVSAGEEKCGEKGGCASLIHYLSLSGYLKLNLAEFSGHKFWLAGGGSLMQPLAYSNNILTKGSFSPIHGTLGGGLGVDFDWGDFVIPVSLRGAVYMPPTKTTLTATVGAQIGFAYKF